MKALERCHRGTTSSGSASCAIIAARSCAQVHVRQPRRGIGHMIPRRAAHLLDTNMEQAAAVDLASLSEHLRVGGFETAVGDDVPLCFICASRTYRFF